MSKALFNAVLADLEREVCPICEGTGRDPECDCGEVSCRCAIPLHAACDVCCGEGSVFKEQSE